MSKDTMPKRETGVYPRAGTNNYQWRIKAPIDLRELYASEWAHRQSLETSDLRKANKLAVELRAEWMARFDEQRRSLNPLGLETVSAEMAELLAARVSSHLLAFDEKVRTDPAAATLFLSYIRAAAPSGLAIGQQPLLSWATSSVDPFEGLTAELADELARVNEGMNAHAAMQMATQRAAAVLPLAQAEARKLGFAFDAKTPGALDALRACLKAYRKAWQQIALRDQGEVIETPAAPTRREARRAKPVSLRDVFTRWKASKPRSPDSIRACERALALFEKRTGNTPVQNITRDQGDDFRAWLQTLGSSSKTAHDRITWVKSLLVYAYRDLELINRQPWEGIDIKHRVENPRKPWTDQQMKAFFGLPLFTTYDLPSTVKAGADAAYWIPLLGLYSGARIGELCQLRVVDVETTKDGTYFQVTEEADHARVKTEAGVRRIPVHSELVRLGFLDYVESVRAARSVSLWPSMRFRKEKPGAYFSDWVNAFHKSETKDESAPVFHELRHTVRTALHAASVDRETIGLLLGHDTGLSEAERTYTHISDAQRSAAIERLRYTPVKLPRVFRRRAKRKKAG